MRMFKVAAICSLVVLFGWAMGAQTAWAGDIDCSLSGGMCGSINFGSQVASLTNQPIIGFNSDWAGTVTSTVYFDSGDGLFTYVYSVALTANKNGTVPDMFTTTAQTSTGPIELFNPADDFGVVTNMSSSGVDDNGFCFNTGICANSNSLSVSVTGLSLPGAPDFTFYAQSAFGPAPGTFAGIDGGTGTNGDSLDPLTATTPEPASLALFGMGLLLMGGLLQRKFAANV
ncbi:MAG: PEP-CTERM sorting domain-containing protein [Terriglobia bacterium]